MLDFEIDADEKLTARFLDVRQELMRQFTAMPRRGTPAADLTDRDKVALAVAAGAKVEVVMEGTIMSLRTVQPIGVADRGDGSWIVAIGPDPQKWVTM